MHFTGASADDNHRQVAGHLADTPADLQTIDAGQHQIEDHRIPDLRLQPGEGLAAVGFMDDLIALILKIEPQQRGYILVIFHQQNGLAIRFPTNNKTCCLKLTRFQRRKAFTFCLNFADQQGQHFVVGGVREHIKQLDPLNAIAAKTSDIGRHGAGVTAGIDNIGRRHAA